VTGHFDVAVLGAGPSGLAAALGAARRGLRVVVLEQAQTVGGLASSFEIAGQRVDHGSHRLHVATPPEILRVLADLLGEDLQLRTRNGRIRMDGRWMAFPLRPIDLIRHAPPSLAAGAVRDLVLSPLRARRPAADTFAARVRQALGPTIAKRFYEPYARKLWGVDAGELSSELFRRRVSAGSAAGLVRRIVRGGTGPNASFWYPRGGFGRISEAVADAATDAGAEFRLGHQVVPGTDVAALATTVISTLPGARTVALYRGDVPTDVREASTSLEYRGAVLVYLVLAEPQYTAFDAHYLPDPRIPVARLSEPKNYRDDPADPASTTVLCAEVPADPGGALWNKTDEALGHVVVNALERSGLPRPHPVKVVVKRIPNVYPVYRVGFERPLAGVEQWAAGRRELMLVGRQALFAHDNTHHALAMGAAAATCLRADGTIDRLAWATARESFRAHVVED